MENETVVTVETPTPEAAPLEAVAAVVAAADSGEGEAVAVKVGEAKATAERAADDVASIMVMIHGQDEKIAALALELSEARTAMSDLITTASVMAAEETEEENDDDDDEAESDANAIVIVDESKDPDASGEREHVPSEEAPEAFRRERKRSFVSL